MLLSETDRTLLPGDEDVAFYRAHGWWISPPLFSEDEIDDARYGVERFYAGECDFPLTGHVRRMTGWKPGDPDLQRTNDYVSLLISEVQALIAKPLLAAVAARLAGVDAIRLWHDQLIVKQPQADAARSAIGWHTDKAYWRTCTSDHMITAWIPLVDVCAEMGTLQVIDGSHLWPDTDDLRGFHIADLERSADLLQCLGPMPEPTPIELHAGQVSFHHCRTLHGSGANRSAVPRTTFSVHMQDAANAWREVRDEAGELVWHRNDVLCRKQEGRPDYADPDICPLLWAA